MSSAQRKAAIAAELARRDKASGVPPERWVYELHQHYGERGGPRTFFPACFQGLDEESEASGNWWRDLMSAAIERGEPIPFLPEPSNDLPDAPFADYCTWGIGPGEKLMIFSASAAEALSALISPCCQCVPLVCPSHPLVGYRLSAIEDVLDAANTEGSWDHQKRRRNISSVDRYAFITERLGSSVIFRIPQHWQTFVLQPVVDVTVRRGLNGMRFRRVWPWPAMETWINTLPLRPLWEAICPEDTG
jgi:hypothetical protein